MSLEKNAQIPLTITALSNDGNGIGRHDGQAVFVPFTAVGDDLTVKIVKPAKTYAFGIIDEIITPSPLRITPVCPIFGKCGGCAFGHMSYAAELEAKRTFVADAMQRLGGTSVDVPALLPSPNEDRYRNKVQYPLVADENGTVRAGFFAGRSHRVIPCADCLLQPVLLNQIAAAVCEFLTRNNIFVYHEELGTGLVRHIYLRHAVTTDKVMLCLVINGKSLPKSEDFCREMTAKFPQIASIILNHNTKQTNLITGDACTTLWGADTLADTLRGVPVALHPLSFYQVNTRGAVQLYDVAAKAAALTKEDTLLDLYCGAGTIGLSMAQDCKRLIGVEIVPEAIESAKKSAEKLGITHAEFLCADAGEAAHKLLADGVHPSVIILDPPRKGCDEPALKAVLALQPKRIVMVSCNPATAARDSKYLKENGYEVKNIQPVDMFPRTKHVECVILMTRGELGGENSVITQNIMSPK